MLLHDLLGLGPQAGVMTQSMQINRPYERWAATVLGGRGWISWPAPFFGSYWEIDLFVSYWNRVIDQVAVDYSIEETLEPLVFGWIDAGQAVWSGKEPCALRDPRDSTQMVHPLPWTELAQKVAALVTPARRGRIKGSMEWLRRLAYFLSPAVSGVSLNVVNAFVAEGRLKAEWEQSAALIIADHQKIIDFFVEKQMNALVKQLGRAVNEHLDVLFRKG